jgi:hypothetical protein
MQAALYAFPNGTDRELRVDFVEGPYYQKRFLLFRSGVSNDLSRNKSRLMELTLCCLYYRSKLRQI